MYIKGLALRESNQALQQPHCGPGRIATISRPLSSVVGSQNPKRQETPEIIFNVSI